MAEQNTTTEPNGGSTNQQTGAADPSGAATEPKTFTQEQVDRIVQERLARAKATPPADYEDLKAKAAKFDQLEEANKSDLEKANDAKARAEAEAADWKAKFERAQAEQERAHEVTRLAAQYGVNAGTLSRMAGDVEDNAKYLASVEESRPKFGSMGDGGDGGGVRETLEDRLAKAKNAQERIDIREAWNAEHRKH